MPPDLWVTDGHSFSTHGAPTTSQQMGGEGAPGFGPSGFFTSREATSNPTGVTSIQPIMTMQDMNFLTMPIIGDDPAAQALEA